MKKSTTTIPTEVRFPVPLFQVQGKKLKKKCCRKFQKGKRCKRCPGRLMAGDLC